MEEFKYQEVLLFWFDKDNKQKWFAKDENFDEEITLKFYDQYNNIANEFNYLDKSPEEILAAIIVLDQFSRNIFRDTSRAFATDDQALALTKHCIQRSIDLQLNESYKHFLYMPLMHSENLEDQELSVKLFASDSSACKL